MPKYIFTLHTGFGCHEEEYEIDDAELEVLNEEERDKVIEECWREWAWDYLDGGWRQV